MKLHWRGMRMMLWAYFWLVLIALCATAQLTVSGTVAVSGQAKLSGSVAVAPTGTNVAYQGYNYTFNSGSTSLNNIYNCGSTSDRTPIIGQAGFTGATLTLSDTGGQAAGANVIVSNGAFPGGVGNPDTWSVWNAGCAATSNTYTLTAGSVAALVSTIGEYSGLASSGGTVATSTGSGTCSVSATASASGLGLAYVEGNNTSTAYSAITPGWNWRTRPPNVAGTGTHNQDLFDNISVSSGSVTFSVTQTGATQINCGIILIPGTPAASPNWNPSWAQALSTGNTTSYTFGSNVTSGQVLLLAYGSESTTTDPSSVADSLGTVYTKVAKQAEGSNTIWIYEGVAPSSGANTVTVTQAGNSFPSGQIVAFNGLTGTVSDTGGQNISSGAMTWTQAVSVANSVVYLACRSFHGSTLFTSNNPPFTFLGWANNGDAIWGEWLRTTTTANVVPSITMTTTDHNVCASVVMH